MCASSYMKTRKKQKFEIHTGSIFEIVRYMVHFRGVGNKLFKVCLVGTLNFCVKERKKRLEIDRIIPDRENIQKPATICQVKRGYPVYILISVSCIIKMLTWYPLFPVIGSFWAFSQPRVIRFIFSLLHLFRQLEPHI